MELWLAKASVGQIRFMLPSLAGSPEHRALISECWSKLEKERRYTVPSKIKRNLCRLAVAHTTEFHRDATELRRAQALERTLTSQGFTRTATEEILRLRTARPVSVEAPDLEKVLAIVNRRAPPGTLRRKAKKRKLRR
jgi:hypothetical protein